jgi:hypothetical protein
MDYAEERDVAFVNKATLQDYDLVDVASVYLETGHQARVREIREHDPSELKQPSRQRARGSHQGLPSQECQHDTLGKDRAMLVRALKQ